MVGTNIVARMRRAKESFRFIQLNAPAYLRVLRDDLHEFRTELLTTAIGLSVGAVAGMLFLCFLSVAVLVSVWDHSSRLVVAWALCAAWGIAAVAGLAYARHSLQTGLPFANLIQVLARELATIEREEP